MTRPVPDTVGPARRSVVADPPGRPVRRGTLSGMRVPGPLRAKWWEWDSADELLTWNRRSMHLIPATEIIFAVPMVNDLARDGHAALAVIAVLLVVAHTAAAVAVLRTPPASTPRRRRTAALTALALTAGALAGTAVLTFPATLAGAPGDPRLRAAILAGTFSVGALAVTTTMRKLAWLVLVTGAAAFLIARDGGQNPWVAAALHAGFATVWGIVIRLENALGRLVAKLQAARETEARLAVTEERLRFSRDVHDVLGHALSAVAVKSELAAEFARRGHAEDATAEMRAVRELAQDALRQTHGLVAGYRAADLGTEMAGARSLLASAGISARVVGEPGTLPAPVQDALAWVVRESATNIVRHSTARTAVIDLTADADQVALRITNDGATARFESSGPIRLLEHSNRAAMLDSTKPTVLGTTPTGGLHAGTGPEIAPPMGATPAAPRTSGTGLVGLRERVAAVGGTLSATRDDDRFVVEARVPVHAPGAVAASSPEGVAEAALSTGTTPATGATLATGTTRAAGAAGAAG